MAARIDHDYVTAEYDRRVIATARYSLHAAADGQGGWIVSGLPRRLFTRNQAITAMPPRLVRKMHPSGHRLNVVDAERLGSYLDGCRRYSAIGHARSKRSASATPERRQKLRAE